MSILNIKIFISTFLLAINFDNLTAIVDDKLKITYPIYDIAINSNVLMNISLCRSELDLFRRGIDNKKLWSLKILDVNGIPKPGFIYGNRFWLGNRDECFDLTNRQPFEININNNNKNNNSSSSSIIKLQNITYGRQDEFPPFNLNYFIAHLRHNSTIQYRVGFPNEEMISLALCLPASCTKNELKIILNNIFQQRKFTMGHLYDADFDLIHISDLNDDHKWLINWRIITVGFILIVTWLLMIIGTIYDLITNKKHSKINKLLTKSNNNEDNNNKNDNNNNNNEVTIELENYLSKKQPNLLIEIIMCFSICKNTKLIFKINDEKSSSTNTISAIHGLRFLGMVWIIMIHSVLFMNDYVDNRVWSLRLSEGFISQIISNGTFSVDTFFVISGFLLGWIFFKDQDKLLNNAKLFSNYDGDDDDDDDDEQKKKNIKWNIFFGGILKRIIRLTPTYMIVLGISEMNFGWYNQTSLFLMSERPQETCAKFWWRNLLYINNFFGRETMCMSWSWYLSDDMQFFIIGLFLLVLSDVYFYTSASLLIGLLTSSTIITGYISYHYEYKPTLDVQWNMLDIFYYPPWTRIGPYLIGIITSFIVIKLNNKLNLNKRIIYLMWIIGSSCNILTLFGLFQRDISIITTAIYVALSRSVWAIGISWLIVACCTNNGGIINKILTLNIWIPLSRLTYCAYLINPLIINSIYLHSETAIHIEFLPNVIIFLGELIVIYICACAITLMAEIPYTLITKLLIKSHYNKKNKY